MKIKIYFHPLLTMIHLLGGRKKDKNNTMKCANIIIKLEWAGVTDKMMRILERTMMILGMIW